MNVYADAFAECPRPAGDRLLRTPVGPDGDRLRALLASIEPRDLTPEQVVAEVETNLWMLSPEAFRYYLPAFMDLAFRHYDRLSVFASELLGALTEPKREDVTDALDRAEEISAAVGLPGDALNELRRQQLEWMDSGLPGTIWRERMAALTGRERSAVRDFLVALRDAHGEDFPFGEPQTAIDRLEQAAG